MHLYEISVADLKDNLAQPNDIVLIDVRNPDEHVVFNIGGLLIPLNELPTRLSEIDKTKNIVTYCRSGGRSLIAVKILLTAQFTSVKSLAGGMLAWNK